MLEVVAMQVPSMACTLVFLTTLLISCCAQVCVLSYTSLVNNIETQSYNWSTLTSEQLSGVPSSAFNNITAQQLGSIQAFACTGIVTFLYIEYFMVFKLKK